MQKLDKRLETISQLFPTEGEIEELYKLPNGHVLFVRRNQHGLYNWTVLERQGNALVSLFRRRICETAEQVDEDYREVYVEKYPE